MGHQWQAAVGDVDTALSAVRRQGRVLAPGQPRARRGGIDLVVGQALPITEVSLAQPGVQQHRHTAVLAECGRGVGGPAQVRGDDEQRLALGQHLGRGDGLRPAQVGQIGVELTLHPASGVELGLTVAEHDQAAHPHVGSASEPTSTSSRFTGTSGQSRHNRSRA